MATTERDQFQLQREQVNAARNAEQQARMKAIERQTAAQGISDSGIKSAQQRTARADVANQAGKMLSDINVQESAQRERQNAAERERAFLSKEAALGRGLSRYGIDVGARTTQRGQDVSERLGMAGIDTTRRGQDINQMLGEGQLATTQRGQDIGLETALRGYDTTQRGQDIQRELGLEGISATLRGQDVQRELGLEGINATREGQQLSAETTQRGQDIEQQLTVRAQDIETQLAGDQVLDDIQRAVIVDAMASVVPGSVAYNNLIENLSTQFGFENPLTDNFGESAMGTFGVSNPFTGQDSLVSQWTRR